jgi:hypothetical protein
VLVNIFSAGTVAGVALLVNLAHIATHYGIDG